MSDFFDNFRHFVVLPQTEEGSEAINFDPEQYEKHYIITLLLNQPVISSWREAPHDELNVSENLRMAISNFNKREAACSFLQLLEMEMDKNYLVMALSYNPPAMPNSPIGAEINDAGEPDISQYLESTIGCWLYNRDRWYQLVSREARFKRKLFVIHAKEYERKTAQNVF
ncbi:hypothetical protein PP175_10940 [Aneurinibacillus sp. Ricciae_BoGa-3]|uniref:hypothetical protein n=1 Tax=Aneurinibacillus sp. Ricciae_BoGa-3 TaxID=3022697 RepID=UPI0023409490|nr:hypothetical protein [Aneurinibacillus sp. Ricciae_BoGa-3]WCK56380.1 hypothetical protein PP175_10940 [Aneurinibacillus sp. Ricciae_BoGa-3]